MRRRPLNLLVLAVGALALAACDGKLPKPDFTQDSAPAAASEVQDMAPQTAETTEAAQDCCCCACQTVACEPRSDVAATPAQAAPQPAAAPARRPPSAPVRYARAPSAPPAEHRSYRRYQGPDIATQAHQGRDYVEHQSGYRQHQQHAYAAPAPTVVPGYAYAEQGGGYAVQGGYVEHSASSYGSSGYASSGYAAAGYGAAHGGAPCCAPRPLPAAGRDAGGYLTWPGKSAPAPYY
jgi:hypothetical protein